MKTKQTFQPSAVQIECAATVFTCMAFEETIRPIVEGYQKRILEELKAKPMDRWSRYKDGEYITNPDHAYLMNDKDAQEYFKRCNEERDKAGLKVENPEFCPLLVAHNLTIKAKRMLIEEMECVTGITAHQLLCSGLDNYDKYVDLTLKLLAPFVSTQKILKSI